MNQPFDLDEEQIWINDYSNSYMENSVTYGIPCNFCNCLGHTINYCNTARAIGYKLHLKGIEVRKLDIETESFGNLVKTWIEKLTFIQIIVLSNRINLVAYSNSLREKGLINGDTSLLNIREDFNISLRFFYYYEPTGQILKYSLNINVNLIENKEDIQLFECPICLEEKVDGQSMIILNCLHKNCNTCFSKYIYNNQFNNEQKPLCCLCRCIITNVSCANNTNLKKISSILK